MVLLSILLAYFVTIFSLSVFLKIFLKILLHIYSTINRGFHQTCFSLSVDDFSAYIFLNLWWSYPFTKNFLSLINTLFNFLLVWFVIFNIVTPWPFGETQINPTTKCGFIENEWVWILSYLGKAYKDINLSSDSPTHPLYRLIPVSRH